MHKVLDYSNIHGGVCIIFPRHNEEAAEVCFGRLQGLEIHITTSPSVSIFFFLHFVFINKCDNSFKKKRKEFKALPLYEKCILPAPLLCQSLN